MMDTQWTITTVAGTGEKGYAGDGGPAAAALLNNPFDLAFDPAGNLCFSDTYNHCIRRIDRNTGIITTIAGCGEAGFSGEGGPARQAKMTQPYGIVIDRSGNTYVADRLNKRVRRVDAQGVITTLSDETFVEPNGLALDRDQRRLFVADVADHRVRVIDLATGEIGTFAGTGQGRHAGDGGPAISAEIFGARAVALAPDDSLYIMERQGSCIRRVSNGIIETVAGTGARGYAGDGHDARYAVFDAPKEMAVDPAGNIFVVDTENHVIRLIDPETWIVTTIARDLARPHGAVVAADGAVYIGDSEHHRVCKLMRSNRNILSVQLCVNSVKLRDLDLRAKPPLPGGASALRPSAAPARSTAESDPAYPHHRAPPDAE
jgi:DNA-binding beta-propeller fold protein YncE